MPGRVMPLDVRVAMRHASPQTPNQLHAWIRLVLGFTVPRRAIVTGHDAPFDYVQHAYFERRQPRDCVVWANRGGGKTQLGAIVTLLELLYKPGIQIRILGGSFEQSSKMYLYLKHLLEDDCFGDLVSGRITGRAVELVNGSRVEVLSQSERAVRGQRVHKLRCDEVELFHPEIWEAAQMVTRSDWCGETFVSGAIETLSTMHRPYGMMQRLIQRAQEQNRAVFQWSVLDTLERCPPARDCSTCPLWEDCRGAAKSASGFFGIDDAIQQMRRVGPETWKAEMLCQRPSRADVVFPEFDRDVHVRRFEIEFDAKRNRYDGAWIAGIDFGYRAPTVLLWAFVDDAGCVRIMDELVVNERTTEQVIEQAAQRPWPMPEWLGADPAGHQRQEHTGVSTITLWRRAGWPVRTKGTTIEAGIASVSRRLRRADGSIGLFVHERCAHLVEALAQYHYPPDEPESTTPVKDGHDHACDALRYLCVNLDRPKRVEVREY